MGDIMTVAGATAAVVVPVAGAAMVYMRMYVGKSLETLKVDIAEARQKDLDRLDKLYVRRSECALVHVDIGKEVASIDKRLGKIEERL